MVDVDGVGDDTGRGTKLAMDDKIGSWCSPAVIVFAGAGAVGSDDEARAEMVVDES